MSTGKEHIGRRIKQIRKKLGRSQKELGRDLGGISISSISGYEAGDAYPNPETLARIARMGEVSLDWLVTGKEGGGGSPDYRLDEVNKLWGVVSEPARNEILNRARELAGEDFPHAEEAGRFPAHSRERAAFIQARAFAEFGLNGIGMQVTRGLDAYLAGSISDGGYYALCQEEVQKLERKFRGKGGK